LGLARKPDFAQGGSSCYLLALLHPDRALFHVAILGFLAAFMAQDNAVSTFAPLQKLGVFLGGIDVRHGVAHPLDNSWCCGADLDPGLHVAQIGQGDISAFMPGVA